MIRDVMKDAEHRMKQAVEAVHEHFKTLRTGRASLSLLDKVMVDYYGTPTPLNQVSNLSIPEATLIVAQPWEPKLIAEIERAIRKADLGLNPASDGKVVRIPVPPLTEERRKEIVKKAHHLAEDGRTAVRNVRREENDRLKKMEKDAEISQDDERHALAEIQKTTDKYIEEIAQLLQKKETEILSV